MNDCPCRSDRPFAHCCGPCLQGDAAAPTAAALMRSRYTAYACEDFAYLVRTWHPATRPAIEELASGPAIRWLDLTILATEAGGENDTKGTVEFVARCEAGGSVRSLHERSRFVREHGEWLYVDGDIIAAPQPRREAKIGRNQPCPCGSGRKYKKCCGR